MRILRLKAEGVVFTEIPDISAFAERVKPVWKAYTDKFGTVLVYEIQAIK
jgi:TRAP-type C4-dicarboxylate transport system substrate-binding protein